MGLPKVTMVYGGPGAGKTTKMLALLKETLKTVPAKEIAYVSFTRQGTYQGVDLAKEFFDLTDDDCVYFKTIHSLAFHLLNLSASSVINWRDCRPLAEKLDFTREQWDELVSSENLKRNAPAMPEYKVTKEAHDTFHSNIELYTTYKERLQKMDFTDMLSIIVQQKPVLPVRVAFIDEAQDLTTLQWQCIRLLFRHAEQWYVAGDPNQSLFEWAGADLEYFREMKHTDEIMLDESHRCCQAVWSLAKKVHACLYVKFPMPEKCRQEVGFLANDEVLNLNSWQDTINGICNLQGTVYLLASTDAKLKPYIDLFLRLGIPFCVKRKGTVTPSVKNKLYEKLQFIYKCATQSNLYEKYVVGNKSRPANARRDQTLKEWLSELEMVKPLTLYRSHKITWEQFVVVVAVKVIAKKSKDFTERTMALRCFANGSVLRKQEDVLISNIHQVKGGEADYVAVDCSVTGTQYAEANRDHNAMDYLLRIFYVAVTRAKQGIYLWTSTKFTVMPTLLLQDIGKRPIQHFSGDDSPILEELISQWEKEQ